MCLDLVRLTEPKLKHKQPFVSLAIQLAAGKELLAFENYSSSTHKLGVQSPTSELEKYHTW